jgi:CRISPR-associated protein Cas1
MSFHIVTIDAPTTDLFCKNGQLCYSLPTGTKSLPLEDVASIVITSFNARIDSHLILNAAKQGIGLVICERFSPTSLLLPACRASDTLLSRKHFSLPPITRQHLWVRTIDAKCRNQAILAKQFVPEAKSTKDLQSASVAPGSNKEGGCAKLFWDSFSYGLRISGFRRGRHHGGLNDLLNYSYAVLLSVVLQKLYALGIDPTLGIAHAARERAVPLAYDLMEPFRPIFDATVYEWVQEQSGREDALVVTGAFRKRVVGTLSCRTAYHGEFLDVPGCIEEVLRGFRRAVSSRCPSAYQPWTPSNSRWAGLS